MTSHDAARPQTTRPADRYHLPEPVLHLFRAFVVAATVAIFAVASDSVPSAGGGEVAETDLVADASGPTE